ncbi:uncharacterized protein LOC129595603 [Paramacrobiotus metropolitanus]|uniref:uncharacterized protein LOC129595603 n=1 Tax=Paramacrobiotus metropolitanus TaxID=2943436 RepID=UPI0024461B23|nr:uncharacterized protein LOC129595603 [Paramacrobiotus metropolitanus]
MPVYSTLEWMLQLCCLVLLIPCSFTKDSPANATFNSTCKPVPNLIRPPYSKVNISELIAGRTWYPYMLYDSKNASNPVYLNPEIHFTHVGHGNEPTRMSPAEVIIEQETYFDVNRTCSDLLEISWFTTDGRQIGSAFDVTVNNTLTVNSFDDSILWKTDLKTFIMFHNCDTRNSTTGNCERLYIYLHTIFKPNVLTAAQKQTIVTAVNSLLKPHCLSVTDFQVYRWDDTLPVCPHSDREKQPDAFKTLVEAYTLLVEKPGSTNSTAAN